MKEYIKNGFKFFYDKHQKLWVLYPIDNLGNRIEWDKNNKPIEADYFNNKTELNAFLNSNKQKQMKTTTENKIKNTCLTTKEKKMIEEICKLKHCKIEISDCKEFLFCKTGNGFIGIKTEKISFIEETENVFRIFKERDVVTIFKNSPDYIISLI